MSMKREEIIKEYENAVAASGLAAAAGNEDAAKSYELFKAGLSALHPVSREQVDVVINSLKLRLENNEEGGVVYIPKFAVRGMIERLEAIENG